MLMGVVRPSVCASWVFGGVLLLCTLLVRPVAGEDTWKGVTWESLQVDAFLDEAGVLHVRENHDLSIRGEISELSLELSHAPEQHLSIRGLYRLTDEGSELPLVRVDDLTAPGQYVDWAWGLRFSLLDEGKHDRDVHMRFRVDYEIKGALTPSWDIPHATHAYDRQYGPVLLHPWHRTIEVLAHWQDLSDCLNHCYRLDHDVHFPTRRSGPLFSVRELSYRLEYARNWRLRNPERELAIVVPDVNYRVQQVFEHLDVGIPPAVNLRPAVVRMASILAIPVLCTLLLVALAAFRVPRRARRMQLDRAWFESNVVTSPPELVAAWWRELVAPGAFERMLEWLAMQQRLRIDVSRRPGNPDGDAVRLRLMVNPETFHPVEREVVGLVLGREQELHSDQLRKRYTGEGFDPDKLATTLLREAAFPEAVRTRPKRWARRTAYALFCLGAILTLADFAVYGEGPYAAVAGMCALVLLFVLTPTRWWHPARSAWVAGFWAFPIMLATAIGFILHLVPSVPLRELSSIGLLSLMGAGFLFTAMHTRGFDASMERRYWMFRARCWARRQLRSSRPSLEDRWIPHLLALGLERDLNRWRHRQRGRSAEKGTFTGELPTAPVPDASWSAPLYVRR